MSEPTIREQLEATAKAHEAAAAEQTEKARRCRAAIAALDGTAPAPVAQTLPVPDVTGWLRHLQQPTKGCTCYDPPTLIGTRPTCPIHPRLTIGGSAVSTCTCALTAGACPMHGWWKDPHDGIITLRPDGCRCGSGEPCWMHISCAPMWVPPAMTIFPSMGRIGSS